MNEIKETCYKGTRILLGNEKRDIIDQMISHLRDNDYQEISIPIIQFQDTFESKVGNENLSLMFNFTDLADRRICLAPEYTAVIQELSKTTFKHQKNVKLFYVQECFRGEKPQAGRYRQFTQLGVEILNPSNSKLELAQLEALAYRMIGLYTRELQLNRDVKRGLDYYKDGQGFEIICNELGAQKQVCGGGEYEGGVGFAIGIDRLLLLK